MGGFSLSKKCKEFTAITENSNQLELKFDINTRVVGAKRKALHPTVINKLGGGCYSITPPYSRYYHD